MSAISEKDYLFNKKNVLNDIIVKYYEVTPDGKKVLKTTTFSKFIALDVNLTPKEKWLQTEMRKLYALTNWLISKKRDPLFQSFPKRETPLTINAYPSKNKKSEITTLAYYDCDTNSINFKNTGENWEINLMRILAHELKHAEQASKEHLQSQEKNKKENHRRYQQYSLLEEALTQHFEEYINTLLDEAFGEKPSDMACNIDDLLRTVFGPSSCEEKKDSFNDENILFELDMLFSNYNGNYKKRLDARYPIYKADKDIDQIPDFFHVPPKMHSAVLDKLREIPSKLPNIQSEEMDLARLQQHLFNNKKLTKKDYAFLTSSTENFPRYMYFIMVHNDKGKLETLLNFYDKSKIQTNLDGAFYRLFDRAKITSNEEREFRKGLVQTWLNRDGKSAIQSDWIENVLVDPEKYDSALLIEVLDNTKTLETLLNFYDKSKIQADLSGVFYRLFDRAKITSNEEREFRKGIVQAWLTHEGKSAIQPDWIENVLSDPKKYDSALLIEVLNNTKTPPGNGKEKPEKPVKKAGTSQKERENPGKNSEKKGKVR